MNQANTFTGTLAGTPEQISKAFCKREILAEFWGPEGFSSTIHSMDFTPGSDLNIDVRGSDGKIYNKTYRFEGSHRTASSFATCMNPMGLLWKSCLSRLAKKSGSLKTKPSTRTRRISVAERNTPPSSAIGTWKTAKPMRRCASM